MVVTSYNSVNIPLSNGSNVIQFCSVFMKIWFAESSNNFYAPCIFNKMQIYTVYLYLETALHVSGGTSTHLQERIQLYLQHLLFVTPLLLSAAIVEEMEPVWVFCGWRTPPTGGTVWQIPGAVDTVVCDPDDGWEYHPKHVEQFPDINKLCNVASCWIYIGILLGAHPILHISRIRVKTTWFRLHNGSPFSGLNKLKLPKICPIGKAVINSSVQQTYLLGI